MAYKILALAFVIATAGFAPRADGATVTTNINQDLGQSSQASATRYFTNNDNAIFSTATDDFNGSFGEVLDAISVNNPDYLGFSRSDVASGVTIAVRSPPTGEVSFGWNGTYNSGIGTIDFTHNLGDAGFDYDQWNSADPNNNMMAITYNFGDMLDFNSNGITDANELLIQDGTLTNGFSGQEGIFTYNGDTQKFTAVPEPSSALMLLAGASLFLRRRR